MMTEHEMFEASFKRPHDFFRLSASEQWDIDKELGILDWEGGNLTPEEKERFRLHYAPKAERKAHEKKNGR